jgi:hypothetical protein
MIHKTLNAVTAADIQSLVDTGVKEQRTIEYKRQLPGGSDAEKKEFLADVCSFANAGGGYLIYGIAAKDGVPQSIPGLADFVEDKERLRLESTIRDGVDPRIPGIHLRPVQGFPNGPVLVLRVPRSWAGPHMVTFKGSSRFLSRSSAGKFQMDVTEIRYAFEAAGDLPDRIRRWRDERLGRILADETPIRLASSERIVVHLVPMESFVDTWRFDIARLEGRTEDLPPLGYRDSDPRVNLDGLLTFHTNARSGTLAYAQAFRSGRIEAVNAGMFEDDCNARSFLCERYESDVARATTSYLDALRSLRIEPPIVFLLSIVGAKGAFMRVSAPRYAGEQRAIDRDVLLAPDALIEDYDCDLHRVLRPTFDAVWNACGMVRIPAEAQRTGNP